MVAILALTSCAAREPMCGGYSEPRRLTSQDSQLFADCYKGETPLTPKRVATQVVSGTNHAFTCKAANGDKYRVVVYEPLPGQGSPKVSSVEKIE